MKTRGIVSSMALMLAVVLIGCAQGDSGSASIFGTWTIANASIDFLVATNIPFVLNGGGTFSMTYQTIGGNSQTGTFVPAAMPENTDILFTVATSSGLMLRHQARRIS